MGQAKAWINTQRWFIRFWFLQQCYHTLDLNFSFFVSGIVERCWKDACGFKWWFEEEGSIKFVTIISQKFFMFFSMSFVIFLAYV